MADRFDPPRDHDWKSLPMRPDIAGQYVRHSDLSAARAEIERLRGLLAEAIQWNWIDFEEAPTESSEACLPLLVDLHQRVTSALAQKGAIHG